MFLQIGNIFDACTTLKQIIILRIKESAGISPNLANSSIQNQRHFTGQ
jgi:hypothetical protein